jgi:hypothetical protein
MHLMAASRSLIRKENEPTAELCWLGWAFASRVKKLGIMNLSVAWVIRPWGWMKKIDQDSRIRWRRKKT